MYVLQVWILFILNLKRGDLKFWGFSMLETFYGKFWTNIVNSKGIYNNCFYMVI